MKKSFSKMMLLATLLMLVLISGVYAIVPPVVYDDFSGGDLSLWQTSTFGNGLTPYVNSGQAVLTNMDQDTFGYSGSTIKANVMVSYVSADINAPFMIADEIPALAAQVPVDNPFASELESNISVMLRDNNAMVSVSLFGSGAPGEQMAYKGVAAFWGSDDNIVFENEFVWDGINAVNVAIEIYDNTSLYILVDGNVMGTAELDCPDIINELAFNAGGSYGWYLATVDNVNIISYDMVDNDACDDAVIIDEGESVTGNTYFATGEDVLVNVGEIDDTKDLWYIFEPETDGLYWLNKNIMTIGEDNTVGYYSLMVFDNTFGVCGTFDVNGETTLVQALGYEDMTGSCMMFAGMEYLIRVAGAANGIDECPGNVDGNYYDFSILRANLTVSASGGEDLYFAPNERQVINYTVTNTGGVDWLEDIYATMYIYSDPNVGNPITLPLGVVSEGLLAGESIEASLLEMGFTSLPSTALIQVVINDPTDQSVVFGPMGATEAYVDDNVQVWQDINFGYPDLTIADIPDISVKQGEFMLDAELKNISDHYNLVLADREEVVIKVYLATALLPGTPAEMVAPYTWVEAAETVYVDELAHGSSAGIMFDLTSVAAGDYLLKVEATIPATVGDPNEANNTSNIAAVTVGLPDLVGEYNGGALNPKQGKVVSVGFNIVNDSDFAIDQPSNIEVYYGTDALAQGSWVKIDSVVSDEIAALASGASQSVNVQFYAPDQVADYSVFVLLDTGSSVEEADEANNLLAIPFTVIPLEYYTLDLSVVGGGSLTANPDLAEYVEGSTVTLNATANEYNEFTGWSGTDDDSSMSLVTSVLMNSDRTVTASFVQNQFELTVNVGEHGSADTATGMYSGGAEVTITVVPETGYRVKSWSGTSDDTSLANSNIVVVDSAKTVSVDFELIPCVLTLTAGDGGTVQATPAAVDNVYDYGTIISFTAVPDEGYVVKNWTGTDDDGATTLNNTMTITSDTSVAVTFEKSIHDLQVIIIGGNGEVTPETGSYEYGTLVDLTVTPDANYRLVSWQGTTNDSSDLLTNQVSITEDTTVTVTLEFTPALNFAMIGAVEHATIPSTSGNYNVDQEVQLNVQLDDGYTVKRWYGTDNDYTTSNTNVVTMSSSKDVTVEIALDETPGKCRIIAGRRRGLDRFVLTGTINVTEDDLRNASSIGLQIRSEAGVVIDTQEVSYDPNSIRKGLLIVKNRLTRDSTNVIRLIIINSRKGLFKVVGMHYDLTGLSVPLVLTMDLGDYDGVMKASEEEVNGPLAMPMKFMNGFKDSIRVDKVIMRDRSVEARDAMSVIGGIAFADAEIDLSANDLSLVFGEKNYTIPASNIIRKGTRYYIRNYIDEVSGDIVNVIINTASCAFKATVGRTDLTGLPENVTVGFGSGSASMTDTVDMVKNTAETVAVHK